MKVYESCLFPVFQELYAMILSDNYPLVSVTINVPHVKSFIESINVDHSESGYKNAIERALLESVKCNQCVKCAKCSSFFYLAIAELKISNFNHSNFAVKKAELESKYGKISFRLPPSYLMQHFRTQFDIHHEYLSNNCNQKLTNKIDNSLIILKGLSSSSPYILNSIYSFKHFTGGGIYLRYNNYGIVIDPGYGFVETMCKFGISIQDIDAIIITHNHIDHTNDMRILEDLNHQFQPPRHIISWYIDSMTNDLLYRGFNPNYNACKIINSSVFNIEEKVTDSISFTPFKTEHIISNNPGDYDENTFGMVLKLNVPSKPPIKIGYTSDTRYFDGLESYFEKCDIIVANISGIYYDDYLLTKQKDKHLGYRGCYYLLQRLHNLPTIFIISEFWSGISDLRFDVCKALSSELGKETKILPGDIGLHIDLETLNIKCSHCGSYHNTSEIHAVRPMEDFDNLLYICNECIL